MTEFTIMYRVKNPSECVELAVAMAHFTQIAGYDEGGKADIEVCFDQSVILPDVTDRKVIVIGCWCDVSFKAPESCWIDDEGHMNVRYKEWTFVLLNEGDY